jgi:hypothetical protein
VIYGQRLFTIALIAFAQTRPSGPANVLVC